VTKIDNGSKFKMAGAAILKFISTAITQSLLHIIGQNLTQGLKIPSQIQIYHQNLLPAKFKMADSRHLEFLTEFNNSAIG